MGPYEKETPEDCYLRKVLEQIRCRRARGMIAEEIAGHMEEQAAAYRAGGMMPEEAVKEAVRQMGDPVEIGIELDRIHRPKMNWKLAAAILSLSVLGALLQGVLTKMLTGAPIPVALLQRAGNAGFRSVFGDISRALSLYVLLGVLLTFAVCLLDYSVIGRRSVLSWTGYFVAVIVLRVFFFQQVNGAFPAVQTAVVLSLPIFAGVLYQFKGKGYGGLSAGLLMGAAGLFIGCLCGSSLFLLGLCWNCMLCMATYAVNQNWYRVKKSRALSGLWGIGFVLPLLGSAAFLYWKDGYRWRRLAAMIAPTKYADGPGYLTELARKTLALSNLAGRGGENESTMAQLGASGDWLLTQTIYCFGYAVGAAVILLLGCFLWTILRLAFRQKNQLGAVVSLGCSLFYAFQTGLWLYTNLGGAQLTSVGYIPFLSDSWSALLVQAVFLGLLLSVCRYSRVLPAGGLAGKEQRCRPETGKAQHCRRETGKEQHCGRETGKEQHCRLEAGKMKHCRPETGKGEEAGRRKIAD